MLRLPTIALLVASLSASALLGCTGTDDPAPAALPSHASPGDSDARLDRALALYAAGDFASGRALAEAVLRDRSDSSRARFLAALGHHKEKRYDVARKAFEQILASTAQFAERESVDHFLGWACYNLGRLAEAKAAFARHVAAAPGAADSHFALGLIALEEDALAEAQARLERAVALLRAGPRKGEPLARALARLAEVLARRGEKPRAEALLAEAAAIAPGLELADYRLARVRAAGTRSAAGGSIAALAAPVEPSRLRFTELSSGTTGLDTQITSGRSPSTQILEVKGGGIALIDYDGDGDLDLFVPNGATLDDPERGPGCRLYENLGGLRFREVTAASGLAHRRWSFGVAVGDVDGDGRDDIHVACFGPNALFRNRGGGRFEDVSHAAGIADAGWGTGCAFGDLDGDGDLDLYVANYLDFDPARPPRPTSFKGVAVLGGPLGQRPQHDVAYENLGDGTFRDASSVWGFRSVPPAFALNVVILDFDGDGRQDVFVGNDSMPNYLFKNRGGRFEEVGIASGAALSGDGLAQATMGIAVGDVDGNGFPDLFTTNFSGDTNTLHLNLDGEVFEDRTQAYGLGRVSITFLGWACGFADFDHDGDEDLLAFNGHVFPQATWEAMDSPYEQTPLFFARRGARFERVSAATAGSWLDAAHRDRTAVFGDLDGDGDVDVVAGGVNEKPRVLRNDRIGDAAGGAGGAAPASWLIVALRDERPGVKNRRGIGSRIEVECGAGTGAGAQPGTIAQPGARRVQRRWIHGGGPFQSASAPQAHFGLDREAGPVKLRVVWPDGVAQEIEGVEVNQRYTTRRVGG